MGTGPPQTGRHDARLPGRNREESQGGAGSAGVVESTELKDANRKKALPKRRKVEMRAEYDFSGGLRGEYATAYRRGTNVVLLDPDLAKAFPDSKSANDSAAT